MQAGDERVVLQLRQHAGGQRRFERGDAGFVGKESVPEEFRETLPVEVAAVAAALVQLVHDAPGTAAAERRIVAVGDPQVRPAQPVFRQILPGTCDHQDAGALLRRQFVELPRHARRELEVFRH